MNTQRRKEIQKLIDRLEELKIEIYAVRDEEQDCYDNLPVSLQNSERGENMYNNIDNLESAYNSLEESIDYLNQAIE